jgi:hypothetical protein
VNSRVPCHNVQWSGKEHFGDLRFSSCPLVHEQIFNLNRQLFFSFIVYPHFFREFLSNFLVLLLLLFLLVFINMPYKYVEYCS